MKQYGSQSSDKNNQPRRWVFIFFIFSIVMLFLGLGKRFILEFRKSSVQVYKISEEDGAADESASVDIKLTLSQLSDYDGSDPEKPIYVVVDGLLYDVSEGAEYYAEGEVYNFLVGKDATTELMLVGKDLITEKYPVVGRLVK